MTLRVVVSGSGNMGRQVMQAVAAADGLDLAGVLEKFSDGDRFTPPDGNDVPLGQAVAALGDMQADVVVDFTNAAWTEQLLPYAIETGVHPVIGTTGLPDAFVEAMTAEARAAALGGVIASNYALGAVLMIHLARIAAPHFDAVEIIEQHHAGKVDAPSGTAITTAQAMRAARTTDFARNVAERETLPDARGAQFGGATIHSVRLPGLVAHQEVIFGGTAETLKLRHDSMGRESFMPGVLRAVRAAPELDQIVIGLDRLLGLVE